MNMCVAISVGSIPTRAGVFSPLSLNPLGMYDPSDLTTLFQDASATVPVTSDGDPVRVMRDKSGNGWHLVAPSDSARPVYKTAGGLHWLLFDKVDDYLAVNLTGVSGDHTAMCAARANAASASANESLWSMDSTDRDYQVEAGSTTQFFGRVNSSGIGLSFLNDIVDKLNVDIVETLRLTTGTTTADMIIDGSVVATSASYSSPLNSTQTFRVGTNRAASNQLGMRLHGFLLFNSALTGDNFAKCNTWLGAKQGRVI